jgi:alkyl sulfatase BDS1-like metallo-beta-lactamase superfamily hydrolase
MTKFQTRNHPLIGAIAWNPNRPAEWINDHIAMVYATSNAYLVVGDEGDIVINTGTDAQGAGIRKKFEALIGRPLIVAKLIFTQSHPDHIGGWQHFVGPQTEIIVQRTFSRICTERKLLGSFFFPRNARILAALLPPGGTHANWFSTPDPAPLTTFADTYDFTFSGRRYHLTTLSSGETIDSLAVWLPDGKTLFFGNWAGALYGALPHFYTARGDRDRSITQWLSDAQKLIALEPDLLITGHGQPVEGAEQIRADLQKLHDVVLHIHDHTVKGMNAQQDLATILQALDIPAHLQTKDGRGPAHWYARSVWEEYAGWFRHERTSELYPTAQSAVWADVVDLAGGATVLSDRASEYLAAGQAEKALHLIEMAVEAEPGNRAVREVELAVYEMLADGTEGRSFDLLGWLEGKIIETTAALDAIRGTAG